MIFVFVCIWDGMRIRIEDDTEFISEESPHSTYRMVRTWQGAKGKAVRTKCQEQKGAICLQIKLDLQVKRKLALCTSSSWNHPFDAINGRTRFSQSVPRFVSNASPRQPREMHQKLRSQYSCFSREISHNVVERYLSKGVVNRNEPHNWSMDPQRVSASPARTTLMKNSASPDSLACHLTVEEQSDQYKGKVAIGLSSFDGFSGNDV